MQSSATYNERDLQQRLAQGDAKAFSQLYDRYSPLLYKEAYRYLRSSELAKDLVQEIFTTVWLKRSSFTNVEDLHAYLLTMSKNLAYRSLLKIAKETTAKKELSISLEAVDVVSDNESDGRDLQKLIESTVDMLPQQQKHVFRLAKMNGMSYAAIGELLNISPNTVKNHIIAANQFIRRRLQQSSMWRFAFIFFFLR